ncbi:MFS transporter [Desulfotignum phosphitoxidans]|uniref:Putative permease of the major facilitator superfamily n=1 Tax=Desulfotignum phosphitoxidans DSM 13687 TaxID=1286635 RepID=S0G2I0_9BACT|nr:MFS transporter [Desulfotignum phosphitoxidans]EMS79659.1 putative permease of the major facilitator superfamily [Desulfotignum phosphitoxidans DSM 13687]
MKQALIHNPMYIYLMVLTITVSGGLHVWQTLFDNFAVNVVHLEGHHVGVIQSVREIPGFLSLLVVYVLLILKEHRLSALSVLLLGIGLAATGMLPSFMGLILTTLVMSFGFHYYETTYQSLGLQYFDKSVAPVVFGKLRSYAALSSMVTGGVVFILVMFLSFSQMYVVFGALVAGVGLWAFTRNPASTDMIPQHKKLIFKKCYWLYYALTFMAGARRQIFMAFAVFLLVKKFEYSVQGIAVLFLINNSINYFLSPFIGKCIVWFGERRMLSLEYLALIFIFISYALVSSPVAAGVLYVLDHVFFNFAIALNTFFQKIADPRDIAPSMAMGFTINHIAAVVLPAVGGLLWLIDYRIPFIAGAGLSVISLMLVQCITGQLKAASADA